MDPQRALDDFDRQMRREARPDHPLTRVERVGAVTRQVGPGEMWNGVLWSGLAVDAGEDADAVIAQQVRDYAALGDVESFEWKLYSHDRPADLGARLSAAGFVPEDSEALMVAEAAAIAAIPAPAPEGVEFVPVTDAAGVELLARVHDQAFDNGVGDRIKVRLLAQLESAPESVRAFVAMAGDEPVCAVRMDFNAGTDFVGLWGGGTVEAWRGRGIYRALVGHRARIAVERGYRYLFVDASDQSRPILARLGFAQLATTTPYEYQLK
ncbi:GNAT family N-acetyltransferase [Streptacidiphilus rugosus]|uniref:GNAT family N-acetyltransferase n=1 Tax=Streptacidiphilus rugosus TaxID=405783 RepID=UPI000567274C|nr:GNAT family N-acetyltransferase [Streptacidiphilus rugosus]